MKKKSTEKLSVKIMYATITPLIFLGIIITSISLLKLEDAIHHEIEEELNNTAITIQTTFDQLYPGNYQTKKEKNKTTLYKGNISITGRIELFDKLKENTKLDYSLYFDKYRIATTLTDLEGSYLVGSFCNDKIYSDVICNGEQCFYNNVLINHQKYYAIYAPYKDGNNNVIGMIGIAKSAQEVNNRIKNTFLPILISSIIIMFISIIFVFIFCNKLSTTISDIRKYVNTIATGNLHTKLPDSVKNREDELGKIGVDIVLMRDTLRNLLEIDGLTRLYNRRTGEKKLSEYKEKELKNNNVFSVAIGDIDFFKKVNDTYGHDCGDEVLKMVALKLKKGMKNNGFVARWGGEEFLLVFDNKKMAEAANVLEEILQSIRNSSVNYNNQIVSVTMTFGVVPSKKEKTLENLFKAADNKLYIGKQRGRNQVVSNIREKER